MKGLRLAALFYCTFAHTLIAMLAK